MKFDLQLSEMTRLGTDVSPYTTHYPIPFVLLCCFFPSFMLSIFIIFCVYVCMNGKMVLSLNVNEKMYWVGVWRKRAT
jgi:hypothetical protein